MMRNEHQGGKGWGDGWEYVIRAQLISNLEALFPGDQELTEFQSQTWLLSFLL